MVRPNNQSFFMNAYELSLIDSNFLMLIGLKIYTAALNHENYSCEVKTSNRCNYVCTHNSLLRRDNIVKNSKKNSHYVSYAHFIC